MELSLNLPNLDQQFNAPKGQKDDSYSLPATSSRTRLEETDIIDLSQINFSDDEKWLFESGSKSDSDLHKWLHDGDSAPEDLFTSDFRRVRDIKSDTQKNIDTRTFTRPKKRLTRPSIEKYNEDLYGSDVSSIPSPKKHQETLEVIPNGCADVTTSMKPLHFDLSQPTASFRFENILSNAPMIDSFQNMSPPSLVNSMCSSTFANLMESSIIKNDPVLREIRDTDYTESILMQETEPIYQSMTDSISSDVSENRRVSFSETFRTCFKDEEGRTFSSNNVTLTRGTTFNMKDSLGEDHNETICVNTNNVGDGTLKNTSYGGTYQRKPKTKSTFTKADVNNGTIRLNRTFEIEKDDSSLEVSKPVDLNATITVPGEKISTKRHDDKTIENIKRLLDRRPSPSMDLNRLSYLVDNKNEELMSTVVCDKKRNSFGSTDSADADYMSISSGSSKNSGSNNKILSIDGINAIVEMQERSLQQIMSTPIVTHSKAACLWQNNDISPISSRNSDPELSSSEKVEVVALLSPNAIKKQKSLGQLNARIPSTKGLNTISKLRSVAPDIRSSQPNLTRTTQTNLNRPTIGGSKTNLNSIGRTLKGSYTSLRPTNANLPVAPPLNSTVTRSKPSVAQVPPIPRDVPEKNRDAQFRPPPPRMSGLPRPVSTGIPRPVSRIPGPKTTRPVTKSAIQGRPTNYH